jgi:hypothetical protein
MRRTTLALLILALAVTAVSVSLVAAASASRVTPEQLTAAGWTCFRDPANPRISCSDPGHGRPVIGDPSPPPSYDFMVFTLDGEFMGTIHLIRGDLYRGEPCPPSGGPYVFIAPLGYYKCEPFRSGERR